MPQVFFNTDTFKSDSFEELTEEALQYMSTVASMKHPEIARKLDEPRLMHCVPNFFEAFRDDFRGWHLHHITGESTTRKALLKARLYDNRPWYEFRFMRLEDHRRIHSDPDIFYSKFYGM